MAKSKSKSKRKRDQQKQTAGDVEGEVPLEKRSGSRGNPFALLTEPAANSPYVFDEENFITDTSGSESGSDEGSTSEMEVDSQKERGPWVSQVIEDFIRQNISSNPVPDIFNKRASKEVLDNAETFFKTLNDKIALENKNHDYQGDEVKIGQVSYDTYFSFRKAWIASLKRFKNDKDAETAWKDFDELLKSLGRFNKMHLLPEGWNLSATWAEEILGKRTAAPPKGTEDWDEVEEVEGEEGELAYDLQSLKSRARPAYTKENRCRVLYWWKTGGRTSDCFVEYKRGDHYTHRIESTDYHDFDQNEVPRVTTEDRRSNMKVDGKWKYSEEDVDKLVAVAWKVPSDYEADDEPLRHISPPESDSAAMIVTYPRTEVLIRFKDGVTYLEARGGLRRLLRRKVLADRVIYKMAEERERKFANASGSRSQGGSQKSVRFTDELSEYSLGRLRHGRRGGSPARSRASTTSTASTKAELIDENLSLRKKLLQLQKSQEPESDSESDSDSDSGYYSAR
ncbi:hypothetical protein FQN50_003606 [Emmonsiellopsis sp. PD_5]|nr:hypothetical protein FQN50_003606 [Emmonsiellopsis sp. PD_5]